MKQQFLVSSFEFRTENRYFETETRNSNSKLEAEIMPEKTKDKTKNKIDADAFEREVTTDLDEETPDKPRAWRSTRAF